MREVYFFQKVVPHYREPLFRRLHQEYGWTVITAAEPPAGSGLSFVGDQPYLKRIPIDFFCNDPRYPTDILSVLKALPRDVALISEFSLYFPATYVFALARHVGRLNRLAFHTHGPNLARKPGSVLACLSDNVRLRLFKEADVVATYTEAGKNWISSVDPSIPTVTIENTIDIAGPRNAAANAQNAYRFGWPQMLFCGRLTKERNALLLFDVFAKVAERYPDARLVVIGGGEEANSLQQEWRNRGGDGRISLLEGIYEENLLAPWFLGSDIFVLPGPGGLSINHALAYGIPVVAFESGPRGAFHGPEIAYVVDNETGRLVASESGASGMASAIVELFDDQPGFERLKQRIPSFVNEKLQIETMVQNFRAVNEVLHS
ncbi:glycosyltransferase [Methylocystis heyeri]|uniref:Glycosyltransferase n=1 Tax=Methylocystis heyeri TaxID=391905 RepID=A0A6B8KFN9_9HYPH|nr:glycosyltransferase [Methylocystis heyeri]